MTPRPSTPLLPLAFLLSYLGFIVYGSLIPFDFTPLSIDSAWQQFQQTRLLQLDIQSRADWIANGILYLPAGFLAAEWFSGRQPQRAQIVPMFFALVGCCLLAVSVEFTQLFFPSRTVSLNDIIAEWVGSLAGVAVAHFSRHWLRQFLTFKTATRQEGVSLLLLAYLIGYITYSLFPYDFLLTGAELAAKLSSNQWGVLLSGSERGNRLFFVLVKLGLEIAAAVPFGIFLLRRSRPVSSSAASILLAGAGLGLGIELAQFFIYSGSSQGMSVITRALGAYAGALLWRHSKHIDEERISFYLRRASFILAPAYLLGLAAIAGWFSQQWQGADAALATLKNARLLPFYYHYYASEARALTSLVLVAVMFAPVGAFAWAWQRSAAVAAILAAGLALIIEASRLFFSGTHPDATNLLIAALAAWGIASLLPRLFTLSDAVSTNLPEPVTAAPLGSRLDSAASVSMASLAALLLVAGFSAYWLVHFPVQPLALGIGVAACAAATWFRPLFIVALVPAALPILDLAPWSGRFFLDEFDVLLAVTLATGFARTNSSRRPLQPWLKAGFLLLLLSFASSTLQALFPWQTPDANSFSSYFSSFNALRISKGAVWAMLFISLIGRIEAASEKIFRCFAWGMTLGLAVTVAIVVREKILFGGLLNFSSDYRVTGPFSAIHTGGAYIECYLAIAAPFVIYLTLHTRSWLQRLFGVALLLACTYGLMATVSRNGFSAFAVACALAFLTTLVGKGGTRNRYLLVAALAAATLTVAIPLFQGSFVQQRMARIGNDLGVRVAHWSDGLAIRNDDLMTDLIGMGVGRYPDTHFWRSSEKAHTSIHALGVENNNSFLRIAPGSTLYVEQFVAVEPHRRYRLSLDVRSTKPGTTIGIALCEKWMLASSRCATWQSTSGASIANSWQHFEQTIDSGELGSGLWFSQRPVKLSFFTNGAAIGDVDNIRLSQIGGPELIVNGSFTNGMDRWYFATDEHLAWHLKSLPLAVFFDQGWLGLLAFSVFLLVTLSLAGRAAWRGNQAAGIALAATAGFLVVGIFDTLIDAPRFLFLLIVLASLGAIMAHSGRAPKDLKPSK